MYTCLKFKDIGDKFLEGVDPQLQTFDGLDMLINEQTNNLFDIDENLIEQNLTTPKASAIEKNK